MKKQIKIAGPVTVMIALLLIGGCTQKQPVSSSPDSFILSIQPPDQAIDVPVTASIQVVFAFPMDTASVAANFCLVGGEKMYEVMDSLQHSRMDYRQMLEWMHRFSGSGHFQWNFYRDSCVFLPDSMLQHHCQYMIYMGREMQSRYQERMGEHGEIIGKDLITHFTTQ